MNDDMDVEELLESHEHYRRLVEMSPDAIVVICDGYHVYCNRKALELYGASSLEEIARKPAIAYLDPAIHEVAAERMRTMVADRQALDYVHERLVRRDGELRDIEAAGSPILYRGRPAALVVVRDITERIRAQQQLLAHQAQHDPLTGLPNRLLLMDRLQQALHRAGRRLTPVAVLLVDLDRFKEINDSLGHEAGDQLLIELATRLSQALRPSDTVARLGGDEFAICVEELDRPDRAEDIARRIATAVRRQVRLPEGDVRVTASIGVALSAPGDDAATLLSRADGARSAAKLAGRDRLVRADGA